MKKSSKPRLIGVKQSTTDPEKIPVSGPPLMEQFQGFPHERLFNMMAQKLAQDKGINIACDRVNPHRYQLVTVVNYASVIQRDEVVGVGIKLYLKDLYNWIWNQYLIQEAMPYLDDDEREYFISGILPGEWDKIISPEPTGENELENPND